MPAVEPSYVCISASRSWAPEQGSMGPCPGGKFGQHRSAPPRRRAGCTPTRRPREGRCNPGCNQARRSAPRQAGRWAARAAARRSPPEMQGTRTAAPGSRTRACNPERWGATARRAPRDCLLRDCLPPQIDQGRFVGWAVGHPAIGVLASTGPSPRQAAGGSTLDTISTAASAAGSAGGAQESAPAAGAARAAKASARAALTSPSRRDKPPPRREAHSS